MKRIVLAVTVLLVSFAVADPAAWAAPAKAPAKPAPTAPAAQPPAVPAAPPPAAPAAQPPAAPVAQPAQRQQVQPETAFALVSAQAEKGNPQAMLQLGGFYEQGVGVGRNYSKAFEWYRKAADAGRPEGYYNLGVCYEIGMGAAGDMAKSIQNYQKAAEMGLTQAMQKLASIYITGAGVPRNTALGMAWLEKAAGAGMPQALNELGVIYLSGLLEQKKDEKKALAMFIRAADLGNLESMKNIAVMYKDGLGVAADPAKAYSWYLIARRGGYGGEDLVRVIGLLEGSLTAAAAERARKDADEWIASFVKRQAEAGAK